MALTGGMRKGTPAFLLPGSQTSLMDYCTMARGFRYWGLERLIFFFNSTGWGECRAPGACLPYLTVPRGNPKRKA